MVIAKKHGKGIYATITVRRTVSGVGVEKIFPIHSPVIAKIEISGKTKIRRAKLYYLRAAKGKKSRLKTKSFSEETTVPTKETETENEATTEKIETTEKPEITEALKNNK